MNSTIYGRIGTGAELKTTHDGKSFTNFTVALNSWSPKGESTTWVRASLFGKQAESLASYLTKGTFVVLAGDLTLHEFEARDGGNKVSLDINVQSVTLGNKGEERPKAKAATADDDIPF